MKAIDDSIYCTEEQVKKALELGAKIEMQEFIGCELDYDITTNFCYHIPTAKQMIGWLEKQGLYVYFHSFRPPLVYDYRMSVHVFETKNYNMIFYNDFLSRKEATLATIDAALDYLIERK